MFAVSHLGGVEMKNEGEKMPVLQRYFYLLCCLLHDNSSLTGGFHMVSLKHKLQNY